MGKKQQGQVIIILLLVMVIILAVALSVASRSVTEIATSTNTENSSRAFSAAEAGIEKLISQNVELGNVGILNPMTFPNQASVNGNWDANLPKRNENGFSGALEYPPFGKESFAQFWLMDPDLNCSNPGSRCYTQNNFDIYFGTKKEYDLDRDNQPAMEVHVIYKQGNEYKNSRYFYDSYSGSGTGNRDNNKFRQCNRDDPAPLSRSCWCDGYSIQTNDYPAAAREFYCRAAVPPSGEGFGAGSQLIMARVRLLYTNLAHPVALKPTGSASLPLQTNIYKATGSSGNVQRKLEVFREKDVMPQFLDYVIFSNQELQKP